MILALMLVMASAFAAQADDCSIDAGFDYSTLNHTIFLSDLSISETEITSWHWDFGDGNNSQSPQPIYAYADYGSYKCCLTVTSDNGGQECSSTFCLEINLAPGGNCQVESDFDAMPLVNGEVDFLAFSSTGPGTVVSDFEWTFDEVGSGEGEYVNFHFEDAQHYNVCLTTTAVNDGNQCQDQKCVDVAVDNFECELGGEIKKTDKVCSVAFDYLAFVGEFTAVDSVVWSFSDGAQLAGGSVEYHFQGETELTVCMQVYGNCPGNTCDVVICEDYTIDCDIDQVNESDTSEIKSDLDETTTEVFELADVVQLGIFPNPTRDFVQISSDKEFEAITLRSMSGQIVMTVAGTQGIQTTKKMDVSQLNSGIYLVEIVFEDLSRITERLVVQ